MKGQLLLSKDWYQCWESRATTSTYKAIYKVLLPNPRTLGKDFDYANVVYGVDADGLWDHMEEETFEEM